MATSEGPKPHVVLFPFMAQGHIIPFLALADLIDRSYPDAFTVTLLSTPLNIRNLRSSLPRGSRLHLKPLPFHGPDHSLPPDAENTDSLPYPLISRLMHGSKSLRPHFEGFLSEITAQQGRPPLCIIGDVFMGWTTSVARERGIFHATFTTGGAYGTAAYSSLWQHLPSLGKGDDEEFGSPGFPESFRIRRDQLSPPLKQADGRDPWSRFLQEQIRLALDTDGLLCNSAEEFESTGLKILRDYTRLPVYPVGPLLLQGAGSGPRAGKHMGISTEACMKWLDSREPNSVLYVSFGSQNTIGETQMRALAEGLEKSGVGFLWVVRPPIGFDLKGEFRDEWLPEGFEKRVTSRGQGLLVRNWAPQPEILRHKAVGGFLSHGGWNSAMESLTMGVALLGWPMAAEQFYNVKMLEEDLGVCVELARGSTGEVSSDVLKGVVRMVMCQEKGVEMRRKAREVADVLKAAVAEREGKDKGTSLVALEELMNSALDLWKKKSHAEI